MNNEALLELIGAYKNNELSEQEQLDFEMRLRTDRELAEIWKLNQEVDLVIKDEAAFQLEDMLGKLGDEFTAKLPKEEIQDTPKTKKPIYIIVALLLLILLSAVLWWQFGEEQELEVEQIYASVYEPYPVSSSVRSTDPTLKTLLMQGQSEYAKGNYDAAISILSPLVNEGSANSDENTTTYFYLGLSHLAKENTVLAKTLFQNVLSRPVHSYTQQTHWYLALAYLKEGNTKDTQSQLQEVINITSTGKYANQAKTLLKELK